MKAVFNS